MELFFWIKGFILGFSIAAPVGPIGILCIRRTLTNGMLNGFFTGVGTACADAIYGCIAAFGLTVISTFLLDNRLFLQLFGGLFLLYLGYNTFQSIPTEKATEANNKGLFYAYTSAFFLTLTNPTTIISFIAVFSGLGLGSVNGDFLLAGFMVLGVFVGSLLWWLILSISINALRDKFNQQHLKKVNQLSGLIIFTFGVLSLISL